MLDLISILSIFILDSIPQAISKGFLILPYITYLSYVKAKRNFLYFFILSSILALHSSESNLSFLFVGFNFLLYHIFFLKFHYTIIGITIISIVQLFIWNVYIGNLTLTFALVWVLIIYFVVNYLYMRRAMRER